MNSTFQQSNSELIFCLGRYLLKSKIGGAAFYNLKHFAILCNFTNSIPIKVFILQHQHQHQHHERRHRCLKVCNSTLQLSPAVELLTLIALKANTDVKTFLSCHYYQQFIVPWNAPHLKVLQVDETNLQSN